MANLFKDDLQKSFNQKMYHFNSQTFSTEKTPQAQADHNSSNKKAHFRQQICGFWLVLWKSHDPFTEKSVYQLI